MFSIERELLPGIIVKIELTDEELRQAWEAHEFDMDKRDLKAFLDDCSDEYVEDHFGLSKAVLLQHLPDAACRYEDFMDSSEPAWQIRNEARYDTWRHVASEFLKRREFFEQEVM